MKKSWLFRMISIVTITVLLLTLIVPSGFKIYAEDDPEQTVITEEASEGSMEENLESADNQEPAEYPGEKAPTEDPASEAEPDAEKEGEDAPPGTPLLAASDEKTENSVAVIDNTYYDSLQEAFSAATAGQTIQLLADVTLAETIVVSKELTIDLNGKKIESSNTVAVSVSAPFTIKDSSATADNPAGNGVIESTTGVAVYTKATNGALDVQAGTLTGATYGIQANATAQAVVNGGRVQGGTYGIYNQSKSTVNGGTITGGTTAVYSNSDTITINGGYIGDLQSDASSIGVTDRYGKIEINGGAFSDDIANNGDSYIFPEAASLVKGEDGWWRFNQSTAKRKLYYGGAYHDVYYATISDAIAEVTQGSQSVSDWVYVIADTTESIEFTRDDRVTVILQGHTLTVNEDEGIKATGQGSLVIGRGTIEAGTTTEGQTAQNIIAADGGSIGVSEATVRSTAPVFHAYKGGTIQASDSNISGGTSGPTATAEGAGSQFRLTRSSDVESVLTGPSGGSPAVLIKEGARFEGDGTIVATAGNALVVDGAGSSAYLRGTVVKSSSDEAAVVSQNGALIGMENGSRTEIEATRADAVVARTGGTVTITHGGSIKAPARQYAVLAHEGGTATIAGFEITGDVSAGSEAGSGTVTVKDGATILGEIYKTGDDSVFDIQGGAFQTDTGNGDAFTRPAGFTLIQDENDHLYRLKQYVAWNMQTGKYYYDINKAKDEAASDGSETIQLLADIDMGWGSEGYGDGGMLYLANSLTLDLNGHTITGRDRYGAVWVAYYDEENKGKVTIIDSSEEKTGKIINPGFGAAIKCDPNTELTIKGGNIVANANSEVPAQAVVAYGKLTINGGNFESSGYQTVYVSNNEDGTGDVTINGGTFNGGDHIVVGYGRSHVTINGGDFGDPANPPKSATVDGNITINGGRFADDKGNQFERHENLLLQVTEGGWFMLGEPVAKRIVEEKDIYYASIQLALNAATEGDTVYLLHDTTEHFTTDKKAALDLDEHKLTVDADEGVQATGGMLTIKNGTVESGTTAADVAAADIISASGGGIVLDEGLTVTAANSAIKVANGGSVEINGANVTGTSAAVTGNSSSLTLRSGSITAASGVSVTNGAGFFQNGGTLSATGSAVTVSGKYSAGYINGGTITADDYALVAENGGSVTVLDGVINGDVQMTGGTSKFSIEGGAFKTDTGNGDTFTREGDQILILGADPEHPNYYALGDAVVHNTTKDEYYSSLAAASAGSAAGNTLKMLKDEELGSEQVVIRNTITLDLNGKTVSGTMTPILVDEGANLTISGGGTLKGRDGIENKGTLTVAEDMSISGTRHGINNNGGTATVNGGSVTGESASGIFNTVSATLVLNGGQVTGSTFGINNGNGSNATVNDGVICATDNSLGKSVSSTDSISTFIINGGHYSDGAGNGDEFTRKDDLVLIHGIDDHYPLMWSLNAVAQNTRTGKKYASLKEAFEETENSDTVVVLLDHKIGEVAKVNKVITLDLAGHTVTSDLRVGTANTISVQNGGKLTLVDSSGNGKIVNDAENAVGSGIHVTAGGEFVMDGGTIKSKDYGVWNTGTTTINNGTITADGIGVNAGRADGSRVTINGGSIAGHDSVNNIGQGTFAINGGRFSDAKGNGEEFTRPEGEVLSDEDGDGWYLFDHSVATITKDGVTTRYETLQAAFDAAKDGDTVNVIADITLTEKATLEGKTITLDIGSYTITNDERFDTGKFGTGLIYVSHGEGSNAGLTLTGTESGKLKSTSGMAVWLESGTRPADGYANFTMDTVTIEADTSAVYTNGNYSKITIESGTIHSAKNGPAGDTHGAIKTSGNSTITINGGTIINDAGTALSVSGSPAKVNGGTLTGGTYGIYLATGSVTVEDGVITGDSASVNAATPSRFTINGGVYSDGAGNADGYVRKDDKVLVKGANSDYPNMFALGDAVASIERDGKTIFYPSLASAVSDAKSGETIVMVAHEALTEQVAINKSLTLDLNGKKISADMNKGAINIPYIFPNKPVVTITDNSEEGNGEIYNPNVSGYAVEVHSDAVFNMEGGKLNGDEAIYQSNYCTVNIKGGSVTGKIYGVRTSGTLNVEGGTVYGGNNGIYAGMGNPGPKVTVSGGSVSSSTASKYYAGIHMEAGDVEITGGSVSGYTGVVIYAHQWGSTMYEPTATVSGGEIIGSERSISSENAVSAVKPSAFTITGGAFSDDIGNGANYTRSDNKYLMLDEDGLYRLAEVDKTALINAIEEATEDKNNTPVSVDGKEQPAGTQYVDQAAQDALAEAIAAAKAVVGDPKAVPDDVAAAVTAMEAAKKAFDDAKKTASADKAALIQAIGEATEDKNSTPVSEDGKDRPDGSKYVDPDTQAALTKAIETAQAVVDDPKASQNEVDDAKAAVEEAKAAFDAAKKTASVDKSSLQALLNIVPNPEDITVSETGDDVIEGNKWATAADKDAFERELADAQAMLVKEGATQNEVDAATRELNYAAGKIQTAGINKSELQEAVNNAISPADIAASADGKDVPNGDKWATEEEKAAYVNAITDAVNQLHKPSSQDQVNAALAALEEAAEKIKTASVDKEALNQSIKTATEDKESTPVSADGKDQSAGTKYVDQTAQDALAEAIAAAQAVADKSKATQNEVDAARAAVEEATQAFDNAKKTATVDKSSLDDAIAAAEAAEKENAVSEDGKDLVPGTSYTTPAEKKALDDAIKAAQDVLDNPKATQNEVDAATKAINAATQTYNDAVQTVGVADKSALEEAIEAAEAAKEPNAISEDGTDLEPGTPYTTPAEKKALDDAIKAAQDVLDDPEATQNEVDAATKAIKDATLAYNNAVKTAAEPVVTITYVLNGGTLNGASGTVTFTCNKGASIILPKPERSGYTFKYWEGSIYYAGDVYIANEGHTFTAIWEEAESDSSAKTGDSSNAATWLLLMLLSGAAIAGGIGTAAFKKKRAKRQ